MPTIIAAVDSGAAARDAAVLAGLLADASGADLTLFAVHPSARIPLPASLRPTVPPRAGLEQSVAELAGALDGRPRAVATEVVDDHAPARAIKQAAEALPAALVVVGSSRRGGQGEATAGRVARQVLTEAPCPVAIAAAGLGAREGTGLRRIVAGVDASPEAQAALDAAAGLAAAAGAELRLVAVAEDELAPSRTPIGEVVQLAEWERAIAHRRAHAERVLAQALEQVAPSLPQVHGEVRTGDAAEELAAVARDADLLVVGSRRWGPLSRIAVGSTNDELMRGAPCSLLLVPRPDGDD